MNFGKFEKEHLLELRDGILEYNDEYYWESHETLEDPWMERFNDPARNVSWAIIQVAASLVHYMMGKKIGMLGMLDKAKKKLKACEDQRVETNILIEGLDWIRFKKLVRAVSEDNFEKSSKELYLFKFPDPSKWEEVK